MIIRIWRAQATLGGAERYRTIFEQNVLATLRTTAGFQRAYLLTRDHDGRVDIEVHTLWESLEAIRAFATDDLTVAVVEPEAIAALSRYDTIVTHFTARLYEAHEGSGLARES